MSYPNLPKSLLEIEEETLGRWKDEDLFRQTLEANADGERFVFFEGPPTANGQTLGSLIDQNADFLLRRRDAT